MSRKAFLVNHFLAVWAFLLCKGTLLLIRIRFAMPFHMLVKTRPIEFLLAIRAHTSQFQFGTNSGTAFLTTTWMVTMMPIVAWFSLRL